ncbi:MAG: FecR domain-containing protein [Pseudomonadales bacterium]|jgi:transmembrane sensor|nr:FecR domain-containing protein [Pseudomonadales bacterium]
MQSSKAQERVSVCAGRVAEESGLWLARLDRGLSNAEHAQLLRWLRQPANAAALWDLAAFWQVSALLGDLRLAAAADTAHAQTRFAAFHPARRWVALAATVVLAIGLVGYFQVFSPLAPPRVAQFEHRYQTAVGEHLTHMLPDGSAVSLNTDTSVQVRYFNNERLIYILHGEAHFTVAHDTTRPFGVRAGDHIVQAVGTAFNVRLQSLGDVEVMVTDGVVRILDENTSSAATPMADTEPQWWLHPVLASSVSKGQVAKLAEAGAEPVLVITQLNADDIAAKLAWQHGELVFAGEPLQTVLDEFGRYTSTRFILASETMATVRVGGFFKAGDIDSLLANLNENFKIDAERMVDGRIRLFPSE